MRVWAKTKEFSEGKFLVTRRDGTTPDWPHFVMGARDPAVPVALRAYALFMRHQLGIDPEYTDSVQELAGDFERYREAAGSGDPDAPPHRTDQPLVLAMMRHEFSIADVIAGLERIELLCAENKHRGAQALARLLLDGRKPPRIP